MFWIFSSLVGLTFFAVTLKGDVVRGDGGHHWDGNCAHIAP